MYYVSVAIAAKCLLEASSLTLEKISMINKSPEKDIYFEILLETRLKAIDMICVICLTWTIKCYDNFHINILFIVLETTSVNKCPFVFALDFN